MGEITNAFNGKLNLDTNPFRIQNGDYIDALNVTRDSPGEGSDIVVTNIIGNKLVDYTLPAGVNKVIGKFPDRIRNRVYFAVWNSNDFDLWLYYDRDNDTIVKLIENITDTVGDVLKFDPSKKINHIDIIYRDTYGDLIFYTDGNVTPRKFNVKHILDGDYTSIKTSFIESAKAPFLTPPICAYGSDSTRNSNSLRRTLFQFCSRPQYDDFEKGVLFSFSKVSLPVGFYGSDNDIDNTKNNYITVTVLTGDENVIAIEIGMRYNIGNNWSDVVLVASLNKAQLSIPNNTTYQFLFYNDTIYPTIADGLQYVDGVQVIPLFFWVPQLAYNQVLANGNVPVYGAIQEGYNNYPINDLVVTVTAANETNSPPDTNPPALTYIFTPANTWTFTVSGTVPTGTFYRIFAFIPGMGVQIFAQYTSIGGDTTSTVAQALHDYISAHFPGYVGSVTTNTWLVIPPVPGFSVTTIQVTPGSSGATISSEKTWMDDCPYAFGLVYFDEQGRDMPGVITFVNPTDSVNDFLVTTPSISFSTGTRQTPVISSSINHLPPAGAKKYCWVRRRLQYTNWVEYETCDFQSADGFYYFCLANIDLYKVNNNNFIYGTAPITPGGNQRIKIKAGITSDAYDGTVWNQDYQILGVETRTLTGGVSPTDDRPFIKVKIPDTAVPSPAYQLNMLVMVYTPSVNPTNLSDSTYLEWGESYDTYFIGNILYHRGMVQDQTGSQPATFKWIEGDVYYHERGMYNEIRVSPVVHTDTLSIIDENFSDFFSSAVNDNGRAQVIEVNAQQDYYPTLYRFGGAYQSETTVNETPDFYFENQDEAGRGWGDIRKMYIRGMYLYVLQKFKIGIIPIKLQIVRDTAGNPLEANSDILLNKINYPYNQDIGIGDIPESFASDKDAMYGADDFKGVVWRLSYDGITKLSVTYECNSFFTQKLPFYRNSLNNGYAAPGQVYSGNPTVYGAFDSLTNKYIIALEEINRYDSGGTLIYHQDAVTVTFNEVRNPMEGFESKVSYHPENIVCLDVLLIAFKDGKLWKFTTDAPYCNFFGVQYDASITAVFMGSSIEKKSWQALTELTDTIWECPEIYSNVNTYGNQRQQTKLIEQNFQTLEGNRQSAIYRDINSPGGWINGQQIKGNYLVIKFLKQNASSLVYLNGVSVKFADSPLTTTK